VRKPKVLAMRGVVKTGKNNGEGEIFRGNLKVVLGREELGKKAYHL